MTAAGRASRQQIANMSDEKTVNVELPAAVSNAPPAPGEPDANTPKNAAGERTSIENAKQFVFGVIALYVRWFRLPFASIPRLQPAFYVQFQILVLCSDCRVYSFSQWLSHLLRHPSGQSLLAPLLGHARLGN
jgi:hypothetical protein